MLDYFLLTYSVNKIGSTQRAKEISDNVRIDIGKLKKFHNLESWNSTLSTPFLEWEKIEGIETAIKGLIRVDTDFTREKEKDVIRKFTAICREILQENNATASTTVIKCACMIETIGNTIEFEITNN